jgi:hypothetical protein
VIERLRGRKRSRPDRCDGCGGWVTGTSRCLICRSAPGQLSDPTVSWQLVTLIETDLWMKMSQAQRHLNRGPRPAQRYARLAHLERDPMPLGWQTVEAL